MQVDIGFGDVVDPGVIEIEYPTLPGFSAPLLRAYPKETVVAEKLEAVTALEMLNSRMKDFFALWALSRLYDFDGPTLLRAIKATFNHRATTIEARPVGLEDEFANDRAESMQWTAFLRRLHLSSAPARVVSNLYLRISVETPFTPLRCLLFGRNHFRVVGAQNPCRVEVPHHLLWIYSFVRVIYIVPFFLVDNQ
jgi:Nucleotidyl transferase AbiEii toxin, Type IV TA system